MCEGRRGWRAPISARRRREEGRNVLLFHPFQSRHPGRRDDREALCNTFNAESARWPRKLRARLISTLYRLAEKNMCKWKKKITAGGSQLWRFQLCYFRAGRGEAKASSRELHRPRWSPPDYLFELTALRRGRNIHYENCSPAIPRRQLFPISFNEDERYWYMIVIRLFCSGLKFCT